MYNFIQSYWQKKLGLLTINCCQEWEIEKQTKFLYKHSEYYLAFKMNEPNVYISTWINTKNNIE